MPFQQKWGTWDEGFQRSSTSVDAGYRVTGSLLLWSDTGTSHIETHQCTPSQTNRWPTITSRSPHTSDSVCGENYCSNIDCAIFAYSSSCQAAQCSSRNSASYRTSARKHGSANLESNVCSHYLFWNYQMRPCKWKNTSCISLQTWIVCHAQWKCRKTHDECSLLLHPWKQYRLPPFLAIIPPYATATLSMPPAWGWCFPTPTVTQQQWLLCRIPLLSLQERSQLFRLLPIHFPVVRCSLRPCQRPKRAPRRWQFWRRREKEICFSPTRIQDWQFWRFGRPWL